MANQELVKYISTLKSQNVADSDIKAQLLKAGWSESEVNDALAPHNSSAINLPPPPVPHFGMWVAFQYIMLFICLYVSFSALGGILYHGVDQIFPDRLDNTDYYYDSGWQDGLLKGYIAGILVTFPIFASLFLVLKKQAIQRPAVKNLKARKFLIYLTMIVTFIIMIGHLITTIFGFLNGTTTNRSLGYLAVTFLIAGTVFTYLLFEVKEDRKG